MLRIIPFHHHAHRCPPTPLVRIALGMLLCLLLISTASASLSVPERLVYDVTWNGIMAGTATQEVTTQGEDLRIVNTIRSSGLVSAFFPIDDRNESVIPRTKGESAPGKPKYYREKISEGKRHREREATFDQVRRTVHVKDLLDHTEKDETIGPRTYDTLSSIYFVRSQPLPPGESILLDVYNFRLWSAKVRVVGREEIRTPLGLFRTIVVSSELSAGGVPSRIGSSTVWLTDDNRRIPVKMTTLAKIGKLTLTLSGGSYWR